MSTDVASLFDAQLLTVDDFARACNVSDKTVRRWIAVKYITCTLVGPSKRIRISREELMRVTRGTDAK